MPLDVRLLAILDPTVLGRRDPVAAARAAVQGGATAVQLRAKRIPAGELFERARALVRAVPAPVYVNDRADVAIAAHAAGVHVGQDDLAPRRIRSFAPPAFRVGISVGTPGEATAASGAPVDYWSVGPAWPTSTKADAGPALGPEGIGRLLRHAPPGLPVIAIGGITAATVAPAIAAGAVGIAASRAVFAAADIAAAARVLREALDAALGGSADP